MPEYELVYFDARGLGEPIRLLLSYVGADWKDNRLPLTGGPPGPPPIPEEIKSRCTFGQLPLLEFDGHILCQSAAILRYLGRKYNLAGKDELESAHIDEIGDAALDFMLVFTPIFSEKDETKKLEMKKAAAATVTERFMKKFDALVEKNGGYLVNNSLTWADISVAHIIDQIERIMSIKLISDDMPGLKKLADNVFNAKGIKEWIAKRPQTHA